jgi:hypothetical protein
MRRTWIVVAAVVAVVAVALGAVLLVRANSSSDAAPAASASASPSPTPTPTPSGVIWAGQVCTERDNVTAAVSALGRNLSYDVTADRSALEQIQRQLTIQALAVGQAIDGLLTSLTAVPVDLASANDAVNTLTRSGQDARGAAQEVSDRLAAAASAESIVDSVREVGGALVAGRAAYEAGSVFVQTLGSTISGATGDLRTAFDSAPECQGS